MDRALDSSRLGGDLASLVLEQVDRVAGVVPEEVVRPAPRLALQVDVGTPEEERLNVEVLDRELAADDALAHPLMARVEASNVASHRHDARLPLDLDELLGV